MWIKFDIKSQIKNKCIVILKGESFYRKEMHFHNKWDWDKTYMPGEQVFRWDEEGVVPRVLLEVLGEHEGRVLEEVSLIGKVTLTAEAKFT